MTARTCRRLVLGAVMAFAGVVFFLGIDWGLPSREADPFLFGDRTPWTGAQLLALAPVKEDPNRGADVDPDPLVGRDRVLWINQTDRDRAEIVRRYRLFTYQPDEYNTVRSLSGMQPSRLRLDPRLYQYGGLWVYPAGALVKGASLVGLVRVATLEYYLDHPEAIGRVYVVIRSYSALWGVVGAAAVFWITRRLAGGLLAPAAAAMVYAMMPVVVLASHEAKPHLAGAVLALLAVLAATRYVEAGTRRWWMAAGATCGAALGMVLSAGPVFAILPAMVLLRRDPWRRRLFVASAAVAVGFATYLLTNPYVAINAVTHREVLRSNLGTTKAMYHAAGPADGLANAAWLVAEGATSAVAVLGVAAMLLAAVALVRRRGVGRRWTPSVLLSIPVVLTLVPFVTVGAGKPGEFGRFALMADVGLAVAAVTVISVALRHWPAVRGTALAVLVLSVGVSGSRYLGRFVSDAGEQTTRLARAAQIDALSVTSGDLAIVAEPAPYCLPPVDLFRWRLKLLPAGETPAERFDADVFVRAVDDPSRGVGVGLPPPTVPLAWGSPSVMSWAAKPFEVRVRDE